MKFIYADSLFALSLLTDYLLCLAAARFCSLRLRRGRYLLAALLGALYAVAVFLPGLGWLASTPVQLAAAGLMGLVAFGGEARLFRCTAAFLALSATFGGMVWAVVMRWGSFPLPSAPLLLGTFLGCYGLLSLLLRSRRRAREGGRTLEAALSLGSRRACFRVLRDSGNCLRDPLTGAEVMIVSPEALAPLLPERGELLHLTDPVALVERAADIPELRGRLRLIACDSVGGRGLLPLLRPDRAELDGRERPGLLIAISPSAKGDSFEGIF
jgi:stage II sporulation protein GA (sporulation sigma-E factor processing peptidase)